MITISDKAKHMLKKRGDGKELFLLIRVKSGGCAGMTYDAELVGAPRGDEQVICREEDIAVVTDKGSLGFMDGLCIDYSDDLISAGFRFCNSSNETSCGCGASFALSGFPTLTKGGATSGS